MTANVIAFPRFAIHAPAPKAKRVRKSHAKAPAEVIPVGRKHSDSLEAGLAACFARMREDDAERARGLERWARGERPALGWFGETSIYGLATEHFGEGPDHYRLAIPHAGAPIPSGDLPAALALAVDTLNAVAFMVRYGGLKTQSCTASDDDDETMRHEECARSVVSDLAAAMVRLRAFGTMAEPVPAERRRNAVRSAAKIQRLDALRKSMQEGDDHA